MAALFEPPHFRLTFKQTVSMDKIYSIEIEDGISVIRFSQTPELSDLKEIIDYLSKNNIYERRLWDLNPHGLKLSKDDLVDIAQYGKINFPAPSKLAIVALQDLSFGLSRLFEVYREEDQLKTMVFRDERKARDWLMK